MTTIAPNDLSNHLFVVAPIGSGKTTFASDQSQVYDDDDARRLATEPRLRELRSIRDWRAHNQLWHRQLKDWVAQLPPQAVILSHSVADAKAMGANPSNTIALLIPPVQWMKQVVESKKDALLAMENYLTVRKDADEWKLPVARDWTAIQLWSQLFSWEVE